MKGGGKKSVGERVSTIFLHIFSLKTIILNYNYITKHKCGNENICNNDVWKWISAGEISLGVSKKNICREGDITYGSAYNYHCTQ